MANIKKPPSVLDRWDKDVLNKCRAMFPKSSAPEISRILYNSSLVNLESGIRKWNKNLEIFFGIKNNKKRNKK